ncbi:MAG: ABC transporter ATP-binding protein [Rhodoferax sp.]
MISTRGLSYHYAGGAALRFADIDLAQGATLLLSGPSGCGKSTWLALIAGLMRPSSGRLTVSGQSLDALDSAATDVWRAGVIGFLPQKLHLSAALTVRQNLALAQWAGGAAESQAAIDAALSALGVKELANRKPAQLSGGQAQRVALARAVLRKPRIILADEPSTSLDDEAAASAVALLRSTARSQSATLVIATHDARVAELLAADSDAPISVQRLQLRRNPA